MSTAHSKAAKEFLKNQQYAHWHDATFWAVRSKRDNMAYGLEEWEQLREKASAIKRHTITHSVCHQCREERRRGTLGKGRSGVQRDCLWHSEESQRQENGEVEVDAH